MKFLQVLSAILLTVVFHPSLHAKQLGSDSATFSYPFEKACSKKIHQNLKEIERSQVSGLVSPRETQKELSKIYGDLTGCTKNSTEKKLADEGYYLNFYYLYLDTYGKINNALYFQTTKVKPAIDAYKKVTALFHKDKRKIKKMHRQLASEVFALYSATLFDILPLLSGLQRFSHSSEIYSIFFQALRLSKNNNRLYLTRAQLEIVMPPIPFSIHRAQRILKNLQKEKMNEVETFQYHTTSAALSIKTLDFENAEYHLQQAEKIFPGNPGLFFAKRNANEMTYFPQ